MKKIVSAVVVLLVLLVATVLYTRHQTKLKNQGTYIPWQPVEYTYKEYNGSPGIDEHEFYLLRKDDEQRKCGLFLPVYPELDMEALKTKAETDTDAMFDMFIRLKDQDSSIAYMHLNKAINAGHVNASVVTLFQPLSENVATLKENLKRTEQYAEVTPLAIFAKFVIMQELGEYDNNLLSELKRSGNYPYMLGASVLIELKYSNSIDVNLFCQAYYMGCMHLYKYKNKHNIICGG